MNTDLRTPVLDLLSRLVHALAGYAQSGDTVGFVRSELSECGIGFIREYAAGMGWSRAQCIELMTQEMDRCRDLTPTHDGLQSYCRVSRAGSKYRVSRKLRIAIFAQLVGKGMIG